MKVWRQGRLDSYIIEQLEGINTPILLLINKIDRLNKDIIDRIDIEI